MNLTLLVLLISTLAIISSIIGLFTCSSIANAQAPATSDLSTGIDNKLVSDMGLTNNSVPVQNTTITYAAPPL
ncbi:MAG TPA: hypothetical protein VFG45_07685 [Candidatus Nitrosocosmicus sp.]|nr:hypothetical protein [Candidatus Nitrosocosmicus sp.]